MPAAEFVIFHAFGSGCVFHRHYLPDILWESNTFKAIFVPAASFADATHFDPPHFRLEAQSQEFPPG